MITQIILIITGFISGSILYSYIIPKLLCKIDVVEQSDDENPGAANAIKAAGPYIGAVCLALDILKGFVPVYIAARITDHRNILFVLIMAAPVLGHSLGVFNAWRGGKAISVTFGVFLGVTLLSLQLLLLALLYILFSTLFKINPHARRTVIVFLLFSAVQMFLPMPISLKLGAVLISGIVMYKNWQDALIPSLIKLKRG